ncbi:metalloregulator ArsR/SmtB family transcription factor [Granulosicoccus sp.]|nr:metalloregulator ArsR/SmtB family transcription factor [Granulosicoccus sp.]MDB4224673.1 metalloregulator ArsR/SmtB family transcription factor [Granulosicoccus sp.]
MNINNLEDKAEQVSELLKLLSAPNRLMILCHLIDAEQNVGELCDLVGMKPPAMSQQLSRLRREGLIEARREGQSIFYSIADKKVKKLMSFLYVTYCKNDS